VSAGRPALRRALRVALALLAVLVTTEAALRVLDLRPPAAAGYPEGLYAAEPEVGYALTPGFTGAMAGEPPVEVRTNQQGFRDAPFGPKAAGTLRILALGDSFAFGHGVPVESAYPDLLEEMLSRPDRPVEVLNLGVPGYNTRHELAQLQSLGAGLEPDLVLVGCYLGNDLSGSLERRSPPPRPRFGVLVAADAGEPEWRVTLRAFVLKHSLIVRNVRAWQRRRHLSAVRDSDGGLLGAVCEHVDWDAGTALEIFRREPTRDALDATRLVEEALAGIATEARALGAKVAVTLLPAPMQYDPRWLLLAHEACGLDPAAYDVDRPNRALADAGARDGYPVLDLTPTFRARKAASPEVELNLDVHFNTAGHALAAQEIAMFLLELGLVE
jgi:lysophospholipase L1-like esterase